MANRFWVGGTGTWNSSSSAFWAATSGAAGGQSVPGTGDTVTFDGSSGGGTVTVDSPNGAGVVTVQSITMGAFTGTLDFATNDNNVTLTVTPGLSCTGTGTRTLNMGDGTWTISVGGNNTAFTFGTTTGLTLNAGASTIALTGTGGKVCNPGAAAITFYNLSLAADTTGGATHLNTAGLWNSIAITADNNLQLTGNQTIATAPTWTGTSSEPISIISNVSASTAQKIIVSSGTPSLDYCALRCIDFDGSAGTATNSMDLGGNSGITITAPSGAAGARVIGG
jgi:hypothetical protein